MPPTGPARPVFTPRGFVCSECGASIEPGDASCPSCQRSLTDHVDVPVNTVPAAKSKPLMIGWMWALTAAAAFAYVALGPIAAAVIDIGPLVLAFLLFTRSHTADRSNAAVKLVVDALVVVASLVRAMG